MGMGATLARVLLTIDPERTARTDRERYEQSLARPTLGDELRMGQSGLLGEAQVEAVRRLAETQKAAMLIVNGVDLEGNLRRYMGTPGNTAVRLVGAIGQPPQGLFDLSGVTDEVRARVCEILDARCRALGLRTNFEDSTRRGMLFATLEEAPIQAPRRRI